jgi:hypothetical protein
MPLALVEAEKNSNIVVEINKVQNNMDHIPYVKIEQFGKEEIRFLRNEIQNALDKIKSKYQLSELNLETINFIRSSFNAKIIGSVKVADENDFEMNEVKFFAIRHGLPLNLIGCGFMLDGAIYNIISIEFKNRKYPIIAKCKDHSSSYKFTVPHIKKLLEQHRVIDIT